MFKSIRNGTRKPKSGVRRAAQLLPLILALAGEVASGATITKNDFSFVNVADTVSQRFTRFGAQPAINSAGAVAFSASGPNFTTGGAFRWDRGYVKDIATSAGNVLTSFGDAIVINPDGVVGFSFRLVANNDTFIGTSDGGQIRNIVDANQQGLIGGGFLGTMSINPSGTVVFQAIRKGFQSQAIFSGNGGPLKTLVDTVTNPNFSALGAPAGNASGRIAFFGTRPDQSVGIFTGDNGSIVVADTSHVNFGGFIDPVINNNGTVGIGVFLNDGGVQAFTFKNGTLTARSSSAFINIDNVTINNSGDIAFFAADAAGGQAIFLETTGGASPVPVIQLGDQLFGSTVTQLQLGRFSINDRDEISFQYGLADRRSGIAIASPQHGQGR